MNTNDQASKTTSQASSSLTQPMLGTGVPSVNYAIAMQQYQFQQSLLNQQQLAQQQAVARAVSIKAAAEKAAARAAEISKLLNGEKRELPKEKADQHDNKREKSESKSYSKSPSPSQSSKSRSASPIRYRSSCDEREEYSPRKHHRSRDYSYSSYYHHGYRGHGDYYRSRYSRDVAHSSSRSYSYCHRSTSRSRRRSPSIAPRTRYYRVESWSPRNRRIRSPSPQSYQRSPPQGLSSKSLSRSPTNSSSISSSPQPVRSRSPRKERIKRSSYSSGNTRSCSTSRHVTRDERLEPDGSSSEADAASNLDFRRQEKEDACPREHLVKRDSSNPSSGTESASIDCSRKRITPEPSLKRAPSDKIPIAGGDYSRYTSSDAESIPRNSGASYDERIPVTTAYPSAEDSMPSEGDKDVDNICDKRGVVSRGALKLHDSTVDRRSSKEMQQTSTHKQKLLNLKKNYEDKLRQKVTACYEEEFACSHYAATNCNELKVNVDSHNCSEDVITVDSTVNDGNHPAQQGTSTHKVDIFEGPCIAGENATILWSRSNENVAEDFTLHRSPDELNQDHDCEIQTTVMPSDGPAEEDAEQVGIPTTCLYPRELSTKRSREKERRRKHRKRHHKSHRNEYSEDDGHGRESQSARKRKRHKKKSSWRHRKTQQERKRSKRKHWDTSSSSSSEDSFSSDIKYRKCGSGQRKRSTSSRRKRGHSSSTSSTE